MKLTEKEERIPDHQLKPQVKFCGMTRRQDVEFAIGLKVDAIGMILVPGTGRGISIEEAKELRSFIPEHITAVVVVRDQSESDLRQIVAEVKPDILQFHGDETPEFCQQFQMPYWKAIAVKDEGSTKTMAIRHSQAQALVFDSWSPKGSGGHGLGFNWALLPTFSKTPSQPRILSGGLSPTVVPRTDALVRQGLIDMLDVSTGIENISGPKGIKSPERMREFMDAVHTLKSGDH